jgi:urate oxidase
VSADEHRWVRLPTEDGPAPDAFLRSADYVRTTEVVAGADGESVTSGVRDLVVMKTTRSAFLGFPRDMYTTLAETDDRLMATRMTAEWRYAAPGPEDFDATFDAVGATLLDEFATHHSPSVQASVWIVGRAMLEGHPELQSVRMILPNLHHWLVDLSPFGQPNPGEVFVATTEPHGLIEATVTRD